MAQFLSRFAKVNRLTDMGSIDADEFERHRSHLFALAYRMLGSASEAEDETAPWRVAAKLRFLEAYADEDAVYDEL